MASLSQMQINADYSPYRKYSKKSKKIFILNKLQIDSGYPQEILAKDHRGKSVDNYIESNKKNLKNFFKDRLPEDRLNPNILKAESISFDPIRVFEIKRKQFQLKNQTKMYLNHTIERPNDPSISLQSKAIEKIQEIFLLNDKTLDFKRKFGSQNVRRFDSYSRDNFRRGTRSFLQKRPRMLKKQAYQKVFGPDISSVSRTLPVLPCQYSKQKDERRAKRQKKQKQEIQMKKQDLSNLLKKIQDFKNKIKPVRLSYQQEQLEKPKNPGEQIFASLISQDSKPTDQIIIQHKQKVIDLIQTLAKSYKQQSVEQNRVKITSIEDLQKIDSKFYSQLTYHKKSRMEKRVYELYKYNPYQSNRLIEAQTNQFPQFDFKQIKKDSFDQNQNANLTIAEIIGLQLNTQQNNEVMPKLTTYQRFRNLATHLIKIYLKSHFYMVKPLFLYQAFWQQKQPFKMEGSYAFFKAIKARDFESVKSFIDIDQKYLYEIDTQGKTPLIYGCLQNNQEMVEYFLKRGCNVDKKCEDKKTALFYALENQNVMNVTNLLKFGANPWSNLSSPYQKMLKRIGKKQFEIVFSNARKIYLAVHLQRGNKKRIEFWHQNKQKINHVCKIIF